MSDTSPAGTESGADPVEEPVTDPGVSSDSHPPKPADEAPGPLVEPQNGVVRVHEGANGVSPARVPGLPPPADLVPGTRFSSLSRYPEVRAVPAPELAEAVPAEGPPGGLLSSGAPVETRPADVTDGASLSSPAQEGVLQATESAGGYPVWSPAESPAGTGAEEDGGGEAPPPRASGWRALWPWGIHGVIETVEVLALALLMFLLVRSVAQNFVVDGGSMEPTFHNGEMLIVNKLAYKSFDLSWLPFVEKDDWRPFGTPEPGDVVVFKFPQDQNRDFIKRVVAVPGQTVEIRGGNVFIDGVEQNEPYLDQAPTYDYGPTTVPDGQIFVLGDNRNNSYDSHSWGLLDQSLLIGRAEVRYWPLDRVGRIDHGGLSANAGVTIDQGATRSPSTAR